MVESWLRELLKDRPLLAEIVEIRKRLAPNHELLNTKCTGTLEDDLATHRAAASAQ